MPDFLGMSDEDFLKEKPPAVESADKQNTPVVVPTTVEETTSSDPATTETPEADPVTEQDTGTQTTPEPTGEDTASEQAPKLPDATETESPGKADPASDKSIQQEAKPPAGEPAKEATTPPNYQVMYDELMAPLQANGRTIELKTPAEVRQLAQMGANYTQKMQAIAPHRKVLRMLENNGLLDEGKLSYLIDLDKKNPEAIKKLLVDSKIDPLDIDTKVEPVYKAGNHTVTDQEVNFTTALEEMSSTQTGKETLDDIQANWDSKSKDVLLQSPELLEVFRQQHENGIYQVIAADIQRRKTFGTITPTTSFIEAYKLVGDELTAKGGFNHLKPAGNVSTQGKTHAAPVVTKPAIPKTPVSNNQKASAASSTRSTPRTAKPFINPLEMSDEEIMKMKTF